VNNRRVSQRVAITAAAGGFGRTVARAFAAQGGEVHVCDVDAAAVESAAAEGLHASVVDVADGEALERWIDAVLAAGGGLDVLVNNAGIAGPTAFVEDIAPADWERSLAVSLTSHYRTCARVVPAMKAAGSGSIINISSTAGQHGIGLRAPYVAAKWAVIGLTKTLAIELGPHGVRANAPSARAPSTATACSASSPARRTPAALRRRTSSGSTSRASPSPGSCSRARSPTCACSWPPTPPA